MSLRRFAIAALSVALIVVVAGWLTGLRVMFHGALLSVATIAFFPFIIIASAFVLAIVLGILGAMTEGGVNADGVEGVAEGGLRLIGPYYRFLARHPMLWGPSAGLILGGVLCWALIAAIVVPGEAKTLEVFNETKAVLEREGTFPAPQDEKLVLNGRVIEDGFGRPLVYETREKLLMKSFTLRSRGYNGLDGGDDLCVDGGNRAARAAQVITRVAEKLSASEQLGAIKAAQCPE